MIRLIAALTVGLFLYLCVGCSNNPVAPADSSVDIGMADRSATAQPHSLLGYCLFTIDTHSGEIDVIPIRNADLHLNLTGVLNGTVGVTAVGVPSESDPASGYIVMDVTLIHPFPTRPQLSGFDVKGVLITPGTLNLGPLVFADTGETRLENADGYTRWWNPSEFPTPGLFGYTDGILTGTPPSALTATVNPYKLFADALGPESPLSFVSDPPLTDPVGRAVFRAGSVNTRRYRIRFAMDPGPQIVFGYAIDASWEPPSPNPPTQIPADFPIEANQPEPYRIVLYPTANTLFYEDDIGAGGGVLRLQINIHDWQGQEAGDIPGEIDAVRIFAPGLMSGGVDAVYLNETANKVRYTADLTGLAIPSAPGEALIICRIGSTDGSTYQQGSAPAPDESLSSYQVITVPIADVECTPDTNNGFSDAVLLDFGDTVSDQICTGIDAIDYYQFEIPIGYAAFGEIRVSCDATMTALQIYDESEGMYEFAEVIDGLATLDLDELNLLPGIWYLSMACSGTGEVRPYFLELDGELVDVTPTSPVEVTPADLFVDPSFVFQHDEYAFLLGQHTWVYDLTDPANPVQIAYDENSLYGDLAFHYPYAYGTRNIPPDQHFLNVLDFSDPYNPVFHEAIIWYVDDVGYDLCMNSTHLFVEVGLTPDKEIRIYEYSSSPTSPVHVGTIPVGYDVYSMGLADEEGPDTYLVVGTEGSIYGYSVEDPSSVVPTPTFDYPGGFPGHISTHGDVVYISYTHPAPDCWMEVLELDHGLPGFFYRDSVDIPGGGGNIVIDLPYAVMADGSEGFTICNVSDPSAVTYEGSWPLVSDCIRVSVGNDLVCTIPAIAGLQVFDFTNPLDPTQYIRLPVVNYPRDAVVIDDYLVVNSNEGEFHAVKTVDISDPPNAYLEAEFELGDFEPYLMDLDGDEIVVSLYRGMDDFFMWVDASDPLNLAELYTVPVSDFIGDIAVRDMVVYASTSASEILVYDLTAGPPALADTLTLPGLANSLSFHSTYMYVTCSSNIEVYDITDPLSPAFVEAYTPDFGLVESAVNADYLYTITSDVLEISDLSVPAHPSFISSLPVGAPQPLSNIVVDGQYVYVGGAFTSPYGCSVIPDDSPAVVGPFYSHDPYSAEFYTVEAGYLYEIACYTGIHIWDLY